MNLIDDELAKAESSSAEARNHLAGTVAALQSRLRPRALVRHAVNSLREAGAELAETGIEAVKRNPGPTVGVVAAVTAFFARKPLARLFRRKPTDR
jgi:hypothetical protein